MKDFSLLGSVSEERIKKKHEKANDRTINLFCPEVTDSGEPRWRLTRVGMRCYFSLFSLLEYSVLVSHTYLPPNIYVLDLRTWVMFLPSFSSVVL